MEQPDCRLVLRRRCLGDVIPTMLDEVVGVVEEATPKEPAGEVRRIRRHLGEPRLVAVHDETLLVAWKAVDVLDRSQ